jgi:hypothetical protein
MILHFDPRCLDRFRAMSIACFARGATTAAGVLRYRPAWPIASPLNGSEVQATGAVR